MENVCKVGVSVNMQFSGLNKIHSQLTAYIQAKLRVRLRFRVRVRLGLGLTDRMHALARIGSKLTVYSGRAKECTQCAQRAARYYSHSHFVPLSLTGRPHCIRKQQCWLIALLTASRRATCCVRACVPFIRPCTHVARWRPPADNDFAH